MHTVRNIPFALGAALPLCWFALLPALAGEESISADLPAPAAAMASSPTPKGELSRFEEFLDQHPTIEARLRESPSLTSNPAFQRNHPALVQFLARHPAISAELSARPHWYIHRELARQSPTPPTQEQLAELDHFLDSHPGVEKLLVQHPRLLRQSDFLRNHPELHEYLNRHPAIDRVGESKPRRLIKTERKN